MPICKHRGDELFTIPDAPKKLGCKKCGTIKLRVYHCNYYNTRCTQVASNKSGIKSCSNCSSFEEKQSKI